MKPLQPTRMTFLLLALAASAPAPGQQDRRLEVGDDWPYYRGDLAGRGFSPLSGISPANVGDLQVAWRYGLAETGPAARNPNSQVTPIVVDGVMYVAAADRIVALDPGSGTELWRHLETDGVPSRRGVAYWPGSATQSPRLYYMSQQRLVALDAASGEPVPEFGDGGSVDIGVPYISVPLVHENVIVVGANTPPGADGGIGNPRAFDARDGRPLWQFNSVPQPGEPGHDTWQGDSWVGRLGANAWPFYFTVDGENDLLYLPLASPLPFGYGGDRPGDNLFANSLVAVNLHSGEYAWHFQTIHHDLWDHDPPSAPTLFDLQNNGTTIPALAITTKSGYLFILDRRSGAPLVEVEERPVAQSSVPGERSAATQPFPRTPPLARVGWQAGDLVSADDTSSAHAEACRDLLASSGELVNAGPYTPWSYRTREGLGATTLLFPGLGGGPNWGGAPYDPGTGFVFVFASDSGTLGWVEDAPQGAVPPFVRSGPRPAGFEVRLDGIAMPCQKPPWGQLTAVDTRSGDIAWQRPLGITSTLAPDRQQTGRPGRAGALVTGSGLLFIGATDDNRFRALATATGELLWETVLDDRGNANPMTYLAGDGTQYVVISATDQLVAFALPR